MSTEKETQVIQVLRHMMDHGSITAAEADHQYGIMRLASRMNDLKRRGVKFEVVMESGENRFGRSTRYALYFLIQTEAAT